MEREVNPKVVGLRIAGRCGEWRTGTVWAVAGGIAVAWALAHFPKWANTNAGKHMGRCGLGDIGSQARPLAHGSAARPHARIDR
jgi:hypothetical protein